MSIWKVSARRAYVYLCQHEFHTYIEAKLSQAQQDSRQIEDLKREASALSILKGEMKEAILAQKQLGDRLEGEKNQCR